MDQHSLVISPSSWPNYENGENGDSKDQHAVNNLYNYLSPFESSLHASPSSDHNSPLGVSNNGQSSLVLTSHNSVIKSPAHDQQFISSPDGSQNMSSPEYLNFPYVPMDTTEPGLPSTKAITADVHHLRLASPQQDDAFLQDLFHHYSMNSTHPEQSHNIDALLSDQPYIQQTQLSAPAILRVLETPSLTTALDSNSNGSSDSNTTGNQITSEEFTPLLSPAVTPFDSIAPGVVPTSQFIMPVPYFDGSLSPSLAPSEFSLRPKEPEAKSSRRNGRPSTTTPVIMARQSSSRIAKMSPLLRTSRRSSTKITPTASSPGMTSGSRKSSISLEHSLMADNAASEAVVELSMPPPQSKKAKQQEYLASLKQGYTSKSDKVAADSHAATPASLMNLPERRDVEMLDSSETEIHLQNAVRATKNIARQANKDIVKSRKSSVSSPTIQMSPGKGKSATFSSGNRSKSSTMLSLKSTVTLPPSSLLKPKVPIAPSSAASSPVWRSRPPAISPSPSLLPKISPHMSPRLENSGSIGDSASSGLYHRRSGSTGNADLSALLASKSNYQNILEGNHNHLGLSYPEGLSADLSSKRTSHKLAEQGRRNRINVALNDLGKVLNPSCQSLSKASIVELAIEHIEHLQQELADAKLRLSKYESEDA